MKEVLAFVLIAGLLLSGCTFPKAPGNNTTVPPGYEVKDFCKKDADCVRLNKCCDCGLGEYVNIYHQENPACTGPRCLCPIALSKGECQNNSCIAVPDTGNGTPNTGFCGWSTNGSCTSDADCTSGGCSGQVCQSKSEEPVITTCEYKDCYNADASGVECGCLAGKCQWK